MGYEKAINAKRLLLTRKKSRESGQWNGSIANINLICNKLSAAYHKEAEAGAAAAAEGGQAECGTAIKYKSIHNTTTRQKLIPFITSCRPLLWFNKECACQSVSQSMTAVLAQECIEYNINWKWTHCSAPSQVLISECPFVLGQRIKCSEWSLFCSSVPVCCWHVAFRRLDTDIDRVSVNWIEQQQQQSFDRVLTRRWAGQLEAARDRIQVQKTLHTTHTHQD